MKQFRTVTEKYPAVLGGKQAIGFGIGVALSSMASQKYWRDGVRFAAPKDK
ncbi:hypothetical protein Q0601_24560 [Paracoccus onubensis]|uniref:hypothetical protein n=1 Tax=Paracoccus onubensis TaxID=1675788 RepID=UPI00272FE439|nr:hypothetical protein [Paracoccus onubensis]MDP0930351.1 hypothetical protein [Paracoccus onubensis]